MGDDRTPTTGSDRAPGTEVPAEDTAVRRIYLDHNATTPCHPEVVEAMRPYWADRFGNPFSIHREGTEARRAVDRAREQVADLIGADPSEIVFVSGGTEADNLAILGTAGPGCRSARPGRIVTSAVEHPAVLEACRHLEATGRAVTRLPVDREGVVLADALDESLAGETALVTVMLANNDVGTIQPIRQIAAAAHAHGVPVHTDAVQAVGRIPVSVRDLDVDLLSMSSHKLHGPKGVGALYVRRGTRLERLLHGGAQEGGRRAGTENLPAIVGFGKACEMARDLVGTRAEDLRALRDRLHRAILDRVPGVALNGHPDLRLPNTLSLAFDGVEGDSLAIAMDLAGVAVSTGSACSSGSVEPSHVLLAMGRSRDEAWSSLRFSVGWDNTADEMDAAAEALSRAVSRLRSTAAASGERG